MQEKYPSISSYAYCACTPIVIKDLFGEELFVNGETEDIAYEQLSLKFNDDNFCLLYGKYGDISYNVNDVSLLSQDQQKLMSIIDDNSICVNVYTVDGFFTTDDHFMVGGAFMGNQYDSHSKKVNTYQQVNPSFLGKVDQTYSTIGSMLFHEITESYEGGRLALKDGVSVPMATNADVMNQYSYYNRSHNAASPQYPLHEQYYINDCWRDSYTNQDIVTNVRWYVKLNNKNTVIDTLK